MNVSDLFLSGSTLATLTGETNMEKQDVIQGHFIEFALDTTFENWRQAWNSPEWTRMLKELLVGAK